MALWLVQPPQTPTRTQTVGYTGGDYFSWDPEVEALFNDQKNEFGISVDALSWIPPRANQNAVDNFQKGRHLQNPARREVFWRLAHGAGHITQA